MNSGKMIYLLRVRQENRCALCENTFLRNRRDDVNIHYET